MITLITGGARSGKSRYALQIPEPDERSECKPDRAQPSSVESYTYIATAELLDDEMRERAERHRNERGTRWRTIEEPIEVGPRLVELKGIVVVDCLTMWLSNWVFRDETQVEAQIHFLCAALRDATCHVRLITNEVGSSIVPENPLGRRFRDWAGIMNERVAGVSDAVYLMVAGIPLRIK